MHVSGTLADLRAALKQDWCDSFDVVELDADTWTLITPFVMPDGDGFTVLLQRTASGWRLSDAGITASRAFADADTAGGREKRFRNAAALFGLDVEEWTLSVELSQFPAAADVSRFLRAAMSAYAAPEVGLPLEREHHYVRQLRQAVVTRLELGVRHRNNWHPQQDAQRLYRTDLRIETEARPVLVFAVGTDDRAGVTALSIGKYREWDIPGVSFAAVRPTVTSKAVARLQDALGDRQVERIDPDDLFKITRAFRDLGVPMRAA
jgi:Domain of unknown function DUF1828